ncbi:FkbM family methyltransferase [Pedobacter sp. MC2016-14]|uniref:FkbM family methyltransferase n=1 Tax=Pedobacter sp. MC2016-14 TaxID=2897327 RepID=UPI001E373A3E|nr:FkbM family methyltransferase [Pedobacter sp. MC2016-14]MCD0487546.1 FkbM family methyltransferase [Pedobacter sp. MC2016-14]
MMNLISKLQYKVKSRINTYKVKQRAEKRKAVILDYFSRNEPADPEFKAALEYLKNHPLGVFPDAFTSKYNFQDVQVHKDKEKNLLWVNHNGHRLYFKRSYNLTTVKLLYNGLLAEQDTDSPHRYTDQDFELKQGDTLLDVGSAEGIFTLSNIELLKKAYLFERETEWVEALEATFEPWKDKIEIISKFVSDADDTDNVAIDTFLSASTLIPDLVKIDVEGAEERVLRGMELTIQKHHPKIALCTYHKQNDFYKFSTYLAQRNYKTSTTKGLMFFLSADESLAPPFFRKGLIRAMV